MWQFYRESPMAHYILWWRPGPHQPEANAGSLQRIFHHPHQILCLTGVALLGVASRRRDLALRGAGTGGSDSGLTLPDYSSSGAGCAAGFAGPKSPGPPVPRHQGRESDPPAVRAIPLAGHSAAATGQGAAAREDRKFIVRHEKVATLAKREAANSAGPARQIPIFAGTARGFGLKRHKRR